MGENNAFRIPRRARRKLDKRRVVGVIWRPHDASAFFEQQLYGEKRFTAHAPEDVGITSGIRKRF
ncbi:hypothetical protein D3C86_1299390 [compost metagenome]